MKYEIGQKVTTPLGVAVIKYYLGGNTTWLSFDENMAEIEFDIKYLKPYKTPHEKLLEMGFEFEEVLDWGNNPFSHNWIKDDQKITIYLSENTITTYEVCKEAIAVLTQYLEWLEESK